MSQLQDWWLRMATLSASAPAPMPPGPLRPLDFDDQDFTFFTYVGTWNYYQGPNWPGGAKNNTGTSRAAVVPSETTPTTTTRIVPFAGTPEEGIDFWGASEDGGRAILYVLALDTPTPTWTAFGYEIGNYCYRYDWNPQRLPSDGPQDVTNYYNSYRGQNIYYSLANPGLIQLRGLPAGRYQFRLQKPANTTDPNDNGNRATYFDGITVYTRHPTFS